MRSVIAAVVSAGSLMIAGIVFGATGGEVAGRFTVEAEGCAAVVQGNRAVARDEALEDAQVKALEQAVGIEVDAETIVQQQLLTSSALRTHVRGIVHSYEVLSEGIGADGLYRVKIRAVVSRNLLEAALARMLVQDRILVVIHETRGPDPASPATIETAVMSLLDDLGFEHVVDVDATKRDSTAALVHRVRAGDLTSARRLGLRFLADKILFGAVAIRDSEHPVENVWSARAHIEMKVVDVGNGELVAAVSTEDVTGFGNTREKAFADTATKAVGYIRDELLGKIVPSAERRIRVEVVDLPDYDEYERFASLLEAARWVRGVTRVRGYRRGRAEFEVVYGRDIDVLASFLAADPRFEILDSSRGRLRVSYVAGSGSEREGS